jgi:hypothetical protein
MRAIALLLLLALGACSACRAGKTICGGPYPLIEF